jgi:hypothetical protein
MSYAVVWSEAGSSLRAGKLELRDGSLFLEGANGGGPVRREIAAREIESLWIARGPADRICGRPALVLQQREQPMIRLSALTGAGALHEIVDFISASRAGATVDPAAALRLLTR